MTLAEAFHVQLKPGTVIRLVTGRTLLVGDVNQAGGICDDCRDRDFDVEVASVVVPDHASKAEGTEP